MKAYCVICKVKREMDGPVSFRVKSGSQQGKLLITGRCPICGGGVWFAPKEEK